MNVQGTQRVVYESEKELPQLPVGWVPVKSPNSPFWLFKHVTECPRGRLDIEIDEKKRMFRYQAKGKTQPKLHDGLPFNIPVKVEGSTPTPPIVSPPPPPPLPRMSLDELGRNFPRGPVMKKNVVPNVIPAQGLNWKGPNSEEDEVIEGFNLPVLPPKKKQVIATGPTNTEIYGYAPSPPIPVPVSVTRRSAPAVVTCKAEATRGNVPVVHRTTVLKSEKTEVIPTAPPVFKGPSPRAVLDQEVIEPFARPVLRKKRVLEETDEYEQTRPVPVHVVPQRRYPVVVQPVPLTVPPTLPQSKREIAPKQESLKILKAVLEVVRAFSQGSKLRQLAVGYSGPPDPRWGTPPTSHHLNGLAEEKSARRAADPLSKQKLNTLLKRVAERGLRPKTTNR